MRGGALGLAKESAKSRAGFHAQAFSQLVQVEEGSFWFQARNQLIVWAVRRCFPQAESYLEIGCGTGFVLAAIKDTLSTARVCGSEIFPEGLLVARQRVPEAEFFQMDARDIPFIEEYDLIGAFDVLEHIEEDAAVLRQFFRAVNPGGGLILTVPQHPSLWSDVDVYSRHQRRYTRKELTEKVRSAGFEVIYGTSFVSLLLPALWLMRVRKRTWAVPDDKSAAELQLGKATNAVLGKIMSVERFLIKRGISFSLGGSLLMLARKPASVSGD